MNQSLIDYTLHLADNSLILGQRNAEWCGHGPVLEQDIAITNISLDLIGQSRNIYQYAATLIGNDATEDSLAYLSKEKDFKNSIIVEQPNGDWAQSILRQFFFGHQQVIFQCRYRFAHVYHYKLAEYGLVRQCLSIDSTDRIHLKVLILYQFSNKRQIGGGNFRRTI